MLAEPIRGRVYLDYTVFLGMNAAAEPLRLACKSLLASRLDGPLHMTWDHVGRCDDVIWSYSRALQDQYYPFMDALHSLPTWRREGYADHTLQLAATDPRLQDLPVHYRLLMATAFEQQATVYTINAHLLARPDLPVKPPPAPTREQPFPAALEQAYRVSLELRIPALPLEAA